MANDDLRTQNLKSPVSLAEYLFQRLKQVGIGSIHGVPGDYNLEMLDYIPKAGLSWVGNVNELNAGYAADGYARVKGISALVTTFGVGELSAINAVAGAYSEYVPLIHIVGTPTITAQADRALLHHTLGNGDYAVFARMAASVSCSTVVLRNPHDAPTQLDDVIRECYIKSRPVYIFVPQDLVHLKVDGERLKKEIDLQFQHNEQEKEDYVVSIILKYLHAAKNPVILVDACANRHRALKEVHTLVTKTGLPTFVAPMGKGSIDETLPNYGGVYAGDGSNDGVRERVEAADLVLSIGAIKSDFNTAGFSYRISQLNTIDFHSSFIRVKYSEYPDVRMNGVLAKIADQVDLNKISVVPGPNPINTVPKDNTQKEQIITHEYLWPRIGHWLKERDLVITETGTSNFGIWETRFPKNVTAISQVLWGSIGYATGACQGAALAAKEGGDIKRTILFTGEGSFQLTAQELSTMIRNKLNPIIFVICNDGYTIERLIHGMDASYNDIQKWDWKGLVPVFGADPKESATFSVKTRQELEELLNNEKFSAAPYLQFVELHMPKEDAPRALKLVASK